VTQTSAKTNLHALLKGCYSIYVVCPALSPHAMQQSKELLAMMGGGQVLCKSLCHSDISAHYDCFANYYLTIFNG
jgi:hypothetical protein